MAFFGGIGYRKSKLSTLHLIDDDQLLIELYMRRVKCEIPKCTDQAVAMAKSGVAWLMCIDHRDAYLADPKVATALDSGVRYWLQHQVADIARHAYQDQEGDAVITFDGTGSLLEKARKTFAAAETLHTTALRNAAAANEAVQVTQQEPAGPTEPLTVRPSITSLSPSLTEPSLNMFPE